MSVTMPTATKILQLTDCKISPLETDSSSAPTYKTAIDIPGIQTLEITPEMEAKELEGDGDIIDIYSRVRKINWTWNNAKVPLNVLETALGGEVTGSGSTPNQKQTYSLGDDKAAWFKIEGQAVYADDGVGDVHVVLYKCKCTGGVAFTLSNEFAIVKASGTAIRTIADKKLLDIVLNETKADIT